MEKRPSSPLLTAGAVAALIAALFAVWIADITKGLICEGDMQTAASACRNTLMTTQLVVALAGLAPVSLLLYAVLRGHRKLALLYFVVAVLIYLAWGVLNDAAVHGWHDLKVF